MWKLDQDTVKTYLKSATDCNIWNNALDYAKQKYPQLPAAQRERFASAVACSVSGIPMNKADAVQPIIESVLEGFAMHNADASVTLLLLRYIEREILIEHPNAILGLLRELPALSVKLGVSGEAIVQIKKEEVLTAKQAATRYGITVQGITRACRMGHLPGDKAVHTSQGWLVEKAAADNLWKNRRDGKTKRYYLRG